MEANAVPAEERPKPDAAAKPSQLREITWRSWRYLLGRTTREFGRDECPDMAAALTYYAVLALLPALIALISLLGLIGQGPTSLAAMLEVGRQLVPESGLELLVPVLTRLSESSATTWGLVLGLAGALWFVSRYVGAFSRSMNRIYGVHEGRPIWKLEPIMIGVTVAIGLLSGIALLLLVISGPLAEAIGNVLGLEASVVRAWNLAKLPVLLIIMMMLVALLYYAAPNVRQPRFRWLSPGAVLAILTWVVASLLFGLYLASFPPFVATYGSLGGLIIFLVWLWLTNTALLMGAELDAEVERARELQAGMPAEEDVQLPARDHRASAKAAAVRRRDHEKGRRIRQDAEGGSP